MGDLYDRYVRAIDFFNAQVAKRFLSETKRAAFRVALLSEDDFAGWWNEVIFDNQLQSRWLERFADPAGTFARNRERVSAKLDQIPIRRTAA